MIQAETASTTEFTHSSPVRKENADYKYINDKPKGILFINSSRQTEANVNRTAQTHTDRQEPIFDSCRHVH